MSNVAIVLKTNSVLQDDRIMKVIKSLKSKNCSVDVFYFSDNNTKSHKIILKDVNIYEQRLFFKKFKNNSLVILLKAIEFFLLIFKKLRNYDTWWCADEETIFFLIFGRPKKLIWDLHELPYKIYNKSFGDNILKFIEKKTNLIFHANSKRLDFLITNNIFNDINKHRIISNYASKNFCNTNSFYDEDYEIWKMRQNKIVYLQGMGQKERFPLNSVKSVLEYTELSIVIVGNIYIELKNYIDNLSDIKKNKVFMVGRTNQENISYYMRKSILSLIFYDNLSENSLFCEPNRFFYCLRMGIPVIVGKNPTMKGIVYNNKNGISINDYGSDCTKISRAIHEILDDYLFYKANANKIKLKFIWENQTIKI